MAISRELRATGDRLKRVPQPGTPASPLTFRLRRRRVPRGPVAPTADGERAGKSAAALYKKELDKIN
jgi:hypothetical protein